MGKKTLFILFSWLSMISCTGERAGNNEKPGNSRTDTFIQDIPKEKNGEPDFAYKTKDTLEKRLGLVDLSKGYDSVFIRLQYGYSFFNTSELVEIFYDKKEQRWQALIHYLVFEYSLDDHSLLDIRDSLISSVPKSGWKTLIKELTAHDIFNLQDFRNIKNYVLPTDGDAVTVQVATQIKYRMYSHINPILNEHDIPDAKKMVDILALIEKELGLKQTAKM